MFMDGAKRFCFFSSSQKSNPIHFFCQIQQTCPHSLSFTLVFQPITGQGEGDGEGRWGVVSVSDVALLSLWP